MRVSNLFVLSFLTAFTIVNGNKCLHCTFLVDTFQVGLEKTAKQHFAGGNTEWEEKKLGKFATSETRFVEAMEYICKLKNVERKKDKRPDTKDIEFKCQQMAEEHEEILENWYFYKQSTYPDLYSWLCLNQIQVCCKEGYYGNKCKPCPGMEKENRVCSGRGKCDGDGTRDGTGKCECDRGYIGHLCSNCDSNYYDAQLNNNSIECKACHKACSGGCVKEGPQGCRKCRKGWQMFADEGCKDVDECKEGANCKGEREACENTEGSFRCICETGYSRNSNDLCVLDVTARPSHHWIRPGTLLRSVAIAGLCVLITIVLWLRSSFLIYFAVTCLLLIVYIEYFADFSSLNNLNFSKIIE